MSLAINNNVDPSLVNKGCGCVGFAPNLTYAWNAGAKTVTVTDASAFTAAGVANINVLVHDDYGNTKAGHIAAAAGNTGALDISGLNPSRGLSITATIVTVDGCESDGSIKNIVAAGSLANWTKNWLTV